MSHRASSFCQFPPVGFPFPTDAMGGGLVPALRPSSSMDEVRSPWHFDRAAALARLDDDEDLLRDVIQQFVSDAPSSLSAIEAAIQQGDGSALRDAAHALKGAAAYLAADDLCIAAQELEGFGRAGQIDAARFAWPRFAALARAVLTSLRSGLPGA